MKTKLTIVCLGAITILILVSFTNVVGIQSTTSDSINDSPLFSIRTNKATNNESKRVITSDYLGKGINIFSFPRRDTNVELIQKFIDRIRTMDDDTFYRFIDYAVNQINHKDNLKTVNTDEFRKELRQIRESKQNIIVNNDSDIGEMTIFHYWDPAQCWFPGKLLLISLYILLIPLWIIILIIGLSHYTTDCF